MKITDEMVQRAWEAMHEQNISLPWQARSHSYVINAEQLRHSKLDAETRNLAAVRKVLEAAFNSSEVPAPGGLDHPTPPEVTHVKGCNCGGLKWHHQSCTIWTLPPERRTRALDEANARIKAYTDRLTAELPISEVRDAMGRAYR